MEENTQGGFPGKMMVVYPATGGQYTIEWPWTDGLTAFLDANGDTYAIADQGSIDTVWLDTSGEEPVARVRETGPWEASPGTLPVDADWTLTGLPVGASVSVGPTVYVVDDGVFEFTSPTPGVYAIGVESWPFLSASYQVTFA